MRLRTVLSMLFAATLCGCVFRGDPAPPPTYYIYGNATEWDITVECFTKVSEENADPAYRKDTSFVIAPGKEFTLRFIKGHIATPFEFGSGHSYLTYSNGEKTFMQEGYKPLGTYRNPLFSHYTYETVSKSLDGYYYKYVFTDEDFEDHLRPIKY